MPHREIADEQLKLLIIRGWGPCSKKGAPTTISLKQLQQVFANTFASEHKQPKETEQRSIDAQVDGEIPLDSGRHAGEAWKQEVQD